MRRQIEQIRKTLALFGVSDPGDVADLFRRRSLPTVVELANVLAELDLKLPPNVTPRFLVGSLLAAISSPDPATLKWRDKYGNSPELAGIEKGASEAGKYHKAIFSSLQGIFCDSLSNGRIEQEINTGIHRVDIMFDNCAKTGFFSDVKSRLSLKSEYVPVECKNYSTDVGSPEYDQLGGRLNCRDRQVGILVVRDIADKKKLFEHRKAKWDKNELIIVLDDEDISAMHQSRFEGQLASVNAKLWSKVRGLQLNSEK